MYCLFIHLFVIDGYGTKSFQVKNAYVPTCSDSEICTSRTKKGRQSLQLLVLCQKMDTVNEVCLVQHKFSDTDRDPFNGNKFVWLYQVT